MHSTTIAKLLAKENIDIQYGNYKTAWFDVRNRILGLPMWADLSKDTNDLFVGHEVGHALYTPEDGWHESDKKITGAPRSYINVTEDARIERFIKRDYPGIVAPMRRGYVNLVEDGFFGDATDYTTDDFKEVKLIDKINLKAKLGPAIEVPFNDEEQVFMDRAMTTETFEEVVELARDILIYTQENQEELLTPPPELPEGVEYQDESGESEEGPQGHDDYETPDTEGQVQEEETIGQKPTDEDGDDESSEEAEGKDSGSSDSEEEETPVEKGEGESTSYVPVPEQSDIEESVTDSASKEYEREKANPQDWEKRNPIIMRFEADKEDLDDIVIPYSELSADRAKVRSEYRDYDGNPFSMDKDHSYSQHDIGILDGFDEYVAKVKKASYYAVKEFEMRKAAFQWQRAQTAKSGTLDMNKIHAYKYNEDIFARVTHLADAKNHGMIMLVDLSGSMYDTLYAVIDQIFHLAAFCKMTAIPFDVYGFTTGGREKDKFRRDGSVQFDQLRMPQLLSSSLKSSDYNRALKELYMKYRAYSSCSNTWTGDYSEVGYFDYNAVDSQYEVLGSTPLNTSLMVTHKLIKKFRAKHGIDKMNLIVLSDGDTNSTYAHRDGTLAGKQTSTSYGNSVQLLIENKWVSCKGTGVGMTTSLLENINKRYGCTTLGFFIGANPYDFQSKVRQIEDSYNYDNKSINKEYRKYKCVTRTNVLGYNEFYLVKSGKSLEASDDGFEVEEDASTAKIRSAFKKSANSKKKNKVLLTNFGRAVA